MTQIIVTTSVPGTHCWPGAPDRRSYLREPHRHLFLVKAWATVAHDDRDVEFHDLQGTIRCAMNNISSRDVMAYGEPLDYGSSSCEMIGKYLLNKVPVLDRVEVWEDGECGALVTREDLAEDFSPDHDGGNPYHPDCYVKPEVVTLCGSTRFKDAFRDAEARLELEGVAVLTVGFFAHADAVPITEKQKDLLDLLHKQKIAMSDAILVLNVGGYVGSSTKSEIDFAKSLGKRVDYLEPIGG